ncbi:MAG: hypothetical protein WBB28_19550 [Crinalium sp.]
MNPDQIRYHSASDNQTTSEPLITIDTTNVVTETTNCGNFVQLPPYVEIPLHQKSLRNQLLELTEKHGFATVLDVFYIVFNSEYPDTDCNYQFEKLVATLEEEGL